jgi:hypothetical protein
MNEQPGSETIVREGLTLTSALRLGARIHAEEQSRRGECGLPVVEAEFHSLDDADNAVDYEEGYFEYYGTEGRWVTRTWEWWGATEQEYQDTLDDSYAQSVYIEEEIAKEVAKYG